MVAVDFTRAALATGAMYWSGPKSRINDAAPREYPTLTWLHRGQDPKAIVRKTGSFQIKEKILLTITPRWKYTDVNTPSTATITENGANTTFYWRLAQGNWARNIYVDEHNDVRVTSDGGAQQFEDYIMDRFQEVDTDANNFQEQSYWEVPNYVSMETSGQSGLPPYSILCGINEFTNGLPTSIFPGGAWSQFQGITTSEAGFHNYIPRREPYSNLTVNDPNNLINALDRQYEYLRFVPPPTKAEYYEAESKAGPPCVMFTDIKGKVRLKQLCRASNDKWEDPTDAYYGEPTFGGVPIVCPPQLETVAAFPTGAAGVLGTMQSTSNNNGGSRYFLVNSKYFKTLYDGDWYMRQVPGVDPQQPLNEIMYVYLGLQNHNLSRRRHGCVYPTANIA
jgi:hypothetical protein